MHLFLQQASAKHNSLTPNVASEKENKLQLQTSLSH